MSTNTIKLSRKELYEQVWSEPMTKLAKNYGLSDMGLRKRCVKFNIPLPGAGYWSKKQWGKAGPRLPLPPSEGSDVVEINIFERDKSEERIFDKEQYAEAQAKIAYDKLDKNRIQVPATLRSPHPLIVQTETIFRNTKRNMFDTSILCYPRGDGLDIRVSPECMRRALSIMSTLIKALESRGFNVSVIPKNEYDRVTSYLTCVSVLGEKIEFCIREFLKQTRRSLTPEEEKRKEEDPWYEPYPKFVHNPSGRLTLEIKTWGYSRRNWSDGMRQRIENRLNDFIIGLINAAVEERAWKIKREIEKREQQEQELRREKIARLRREEEERVQALRIPVSVSTHFGMVFPPVPV